VFRFQQENNKLGETITELKLKHSHKMMLAMAEVFVFISTVYAACFVSLCVFFYFLCGIHLFTF
jgi:hypothetical protein